MSGRTGTRVRQLGLVALIVGTLAAIVGPKLLRERERAINQACDNIYVALNGEVGGELVLDQFGWRAARAQCGARTTEDLIACALNKHQDEANPRNRRQRAFTSGQPDSCQVKLAPLATNGLTFTQFAHPGDRTPRTYSIRLD